MRFIPPVVSFFSSLKLAVVLILYLILSSIVITLLVAPEKSAAFYRSILFLVPAGLFFLNTLACTVGRMFKRRGKGLLRGIGPDIIHIGLLILIIGGAVTLAQKEQGFVFLPENGTVILPEGNGSLTLNRFIFDTYQDGRPKAWISHVTVADAAGKESKASIAVNKPLKIGRILIYQASYRQTAGKAAETGPVFESGLQFVKDPGFGIVLPACIIIFLGLFITLINKVPGAARRIKDVPGGRNK